jgi:hypothetical protein
MKTKRPRQSWKTVRLTAKHLDKLAALASRKGLLYGGIPSAAKAVAWLIDKEEQKEDRP